jgi:hypothetical protein
MGSNQKKANKGGVFGERRPKERMEDQEENK